MKTNIKWYKSKINWTAIILILTALQPLILEQDFNNMTLQNWISFVVGIVIIILRTYFTNQPAKRVYKKRV